MVLSENFKKYSTVIGAFLVHGAISSYVLPSVCAPYFISYIRLFCHSNVRYSETLWVISCYIFCLSVSATTSGLILNRFKINLKIVSIVGSILMRFLIYIIT